MNAMQITYLFSYAADVAEWYPTAELYPPQHMPQFNL